MGSRSRIATIATVLALVLGAAMPAMAAEGPKHKSCAGFGHLFASAAQDPGEGVSNLGEVIAFNATNEVTAPWGITYTPPGSIAAIVHDEMILLGFCETP